MMMITDPDEQMAFISKPLVDFLMSHEATFRVARADFSVEKMDGQHIDYYRANPTLSVSWSSTTAHRGRSGTRSPGRLILVDMA